MDMVLLLMSWFVLCDLTLGYVTRLSNKMSHNIFVDLPFVCMARVGLYILSNAPSHFIFLLGSFICVYFLNKVCVKKKMFLVLDRSNTLRTLTSKTRILKEIIDPTINKCCIWLRTWGVSSCGDPECESLERQTNNRRLKFYLRSQTQVMMIGRPNSLLWS